MKHIRRLLELVIFNVKWMLNLFYFGLIIVLLLYAIAYSKEVWHLVGEMQGLTTDKMMLIILEMVDVVMIANLVKMIIAGSYNSFVSKEHGYKNENSSSGILKVKMSTSIVGVSSIHLLQTFVNAHNVEWVDMMKQVVIHSTFLIGAFVMVLIEFFHVKVEVMEHELQKHA